MNTSIRPIRTEARVAHLAIGATAVAILSLGLTACQTGKIVTLDSAQPRPQVVAPEGVDLNRTADRIEADIARMRQLNAERFRGRPADRVEEELQREEDARLGLVPGCLSYVLIEHGAPTSSRVICIQRDS